MDSVYAESIVVVSGGGLVVATPSPRVRGAVLINVETTPLSMLIFHLRDMGELWHQPRMPLIKVGPHLPLPAVNKTPLMAICLSLWGRPRDYPHPGSNERKQTLPNLWYMSLISLWSYLGKVSHVSRRDPTVMDRTVAGKRYLVIFLGNVGLDWETLFKGDLAFLVV